MLKWTDYVSDVQEVIQKISGEDSLQSVVDDLQEGLEDSEITLVSIGDIKAISYHGVILKSKADVWRFFSIQPKIRKKNYEDLLELLDVSQSKSDFANKFNEYVGSKDYIKVFRDKIIIENKIYNNKSDIVNDFKLIVDTEYIKEMCEHYEESLDGLSIVCDGISLITTSEDVLYRTARKRYPIEGYLNKAKNKIEWYSVSDVAFRVQHSTGGDIRVLKGFQDSSYTFFRKVSIFDIGVEKRIYPVAILEKDVYAFAFRKNAPIAKEVNCEKTTNTDSSSLFHKRI